MKFSGACPICSGKMFDKGTFVDESLLAVLCDNPPDHQIVFGHRGDNNIKVIRLKLEEFPNKLMYWNFDNKAFYFHDLQNSKMTPNIRIFEPNFSNRDKLCNRLKTCLVFC